MLLLDLANRGQTRSWVGTGANSFLHRGVTNNILHVHDRRKKSSNAKVYSHWKQYRNCGTATTTKLVPVGHSYIYFTLLFELGRMGEFSL